MSLIFFLLVGSMATTIVSQSDQKVIADAMPKLFASTFPTAVASNISRKCISDSQAYTTALLNKTKWALTMYDSTGKFADSTSLYGQAKTHSFGLFDECLTVQATWNLSTFGGKYCTAFFTPEPVQTDEIDIDHDPFEINSWIQAYQLQQWFYPISQFSRRLKLKRPKNREYRTSSKFSALRLPSVGYCIPSSCSGDDFRYALAQQVGIFISVGNETSIDEEKQYTSLVTLAGDNYCYTQEMINKTPNFDILDTAFIVIFSFLGLTIVLATLHEGFSQFVDRPINLKEEGRAVAIFHCFSALSNVRKLLSTNVSSDNLSCLHGIRFLSMAWIVVLHTHTVTLLRNSYNTYMLAEDSLKWQVQTIANASVSVDTFFVMSALLVTCSLMKELDGKNGRFNVPLFYIHRYLRLTPVYAAILGFIATLLVYTGFGPHWLLVRNMKISCRSNWWTNFLYINNYVSLLPDSNECMGETWYSSCDMQMFWLSPLFIYPLWRWWKAGISWIVVAIMVCLSGTVAIYIVGALPPTDMFSTRRSTANFPYSYYRDYYFQTWTRSPPYLIGILIGWIIHKNRKSNFAMKKMIVFVGWILSTLTGLSVVYGLVPHLDPIEVPVINPISRVAYGSLHRLAWSIAIGWVIFACVHGYGGFVNHLLSWKGFIPLGRLTYVAYLINFNFVRIMLYQSRKPLYYTHLDQFMNYIAVVTLVFMMSFVICLCIETPFLNLERVLFKPAGKQKRITKSDGEESKDANI